MKSRNKKNPQKSEIENSLGFPTSSRHRNLFNSVGNKKSQEEMLGFVLIVVLVSVILLILMMIYLNRDSTQGDMENAEAGNYLTSLIQMTSDCKDYGGYKSVRELAFSCLDGESCLDGRETCEVLELEISEALETSWPLENRPEKGYEFLLKVENATRLQVTEGNSTGNFIGGVKDYSRGGEEVFISLRVYY